MITYSVEDIKRVEISTRGQSKSIRWYDEHHCRISASNFGTFCKGLITTNKVKSLLYSGFKSTFTSSAIPWGKTHETSAFHQYQASLSTDSFCVNQAFTSLTMASWQLHLMVLLCQLRHLSAV